MKIFKMTPQTRRWMLAFTVAVTTLMTLQACKPRKKSSLKGEGPDPYLFIGGACQTSGRWVDAAIQQAEQIKSVITALRDDPKCKSMVNGMDALVANPGEVSDGSTANAKAAVAQMFGVGREINAISQYRRIRNRYAPPGSVGFENEYNVNIDKMLTDRMFQMIGLNTSTADATAPIAGAAENPQQKSAMTEAGNVVEQVISMKARALRTASTGLDVATTVFNSLGDDEQCLIGKTPQIGSLAIAGAKLLGTYVGADAGLATKAGSAIAAYFKFATNKKFNNAIQGINETEFLLSISCLMETTSANYCAVRDARYLQEDLIPKVGGLKTMWNREENVPDMMTGFKVLNQDVPVVAEWLRKVVTGVIPRRTSDAAYYNSVMGSLNGLQQVLNFALTAIAEKRYNWPKEDAQQRVEILNLARNIQDIFQSAASKLDSSGTGSFPDFYGMASPQLRQLFDILGVEFPNECDPSKHKNQNEVKSPSVYLEAGGSYAPLASPKAILDRMEGNVKGIFDRMSLLVTAYVRNNLNIDQPNVATDFVAPSVTGNALQRIQQIRAYLVMLCTRIAKSVKDKTAKAEDKMFAKLFMDTIMRIDRVLDAQREILDDADKMFESGEFDRFLEDAKKRKPISLALEDSAVSGDDQGTMFGKLPAKRAKFADRYRGSLASPEDAAMMKAFEVILDGDNISMADWFIDEAAQLEVSIEVAKSKNNSRIRAAGNTSLGLNTDNLDTSIYSILLNSAFDQFDMLRFREAFFINRISKAVYWDISKQLVTMQSDYAAAQNNPAAQAAYKQKWSGVTQKIAIMADNFVVDKINNLIPKDLQASMIDQSKAVAMNQSNLGALTLFKDPLLKRIGQLKSITEGKTSDWAIQRDLVKNTIWNPYRTFNRLIQFDPKAFGVYIGASSATDPIAATVGRMYTAFTEDYYDGFVLGIGRMVRPDLYWSPHYWTDKTHYKDDEFGSLATFRGVLCAQTLALNDPLAFIDVCRGSVLQSVFEKTADSPTDQIAQQILKTPKSTLDPDALSLSYDEWIGRHQKLHNLTTLEAKQFESRRICAVYDHLRNNNIHMMKLRNLGDAQIANTLGQTHAP